jgi:uncharacterized protein YjbJ (UPF0337 family)
MKDLKRESMKQQLKGTAKDMKGRVKEAAGTLAGREDWEAEGELDQLEGQVRRGIGRAGERISDIADDLGKDRDR